MGQGFVVGALVQNLRELWSEELLLITVIPAFADVNRRVLALTSLGNMRTAEPKIQTALENGPQALHIAILLEISYFPSILSLILYRSSSPQLPCAPETLAGFYHSYGKNVLHPWFPDHACV